MRRTVSVKDITTFAQLDMIYNQVRIIEAKQNASKYKCLGSGECCKIGLQIPMLECANIAFHLRHNYYLTLESLGEEKADEWMNSVIENLKEAMFDEHWEQGGETKRHCAFYKNGCTIYEFRPMVCRSFGTISSVDDFCPRIRNENGSIDRFGGPGVQKIVQDYQYLIKQYSLDKDQYYDVTVYMPLGVLSFLLPPEELEELKEKTDDKFWTAALGWFNYVVSFTREHGISIEEIRKESERTGIEIAFTQEKD